MIDQEIVQDGIHYVPTKAAARRVGLSADYIARFCREGLVAATRHAGAWYVNENSLETYLAEQERQREVYRWKLSADAKEESHRAKFSAADMITPYPPQRKRSGKLAEVLLATLTLFAVTVSGALAFQNIAPEKFAAAINFGSTAREQFAAAATSLPWLDEFASNIYRTFCSYITNCENEQSEFATSSSQEKGQNRNTTKSAQIKSTPSKPAPLGATTTPVVSQKSATPTTVINQPVVERIRETVRTVVEPGVNASYVDDRLSLLENSLLAKISGVSSSASNSITQVYTTVGEMGRIEHLDELDLTDPTITGGTIANATISSLASPLPIGSGGTGTSSAPTYGKMLLGNSSGTYDLTATSSLGLPTFADVTSSVSSATFGKSWEISNGALAPTTTLGILVSASSTFNGGISADRATTTNATSTNLFSTLGRFTSAIADALTATAATITNLTSTTLVATNATTTNLYAGNLAAATASFGATATSTFTSDGKLGIGTTNPSSALTIGRPISPSAYGGGASMIDFKSYYTGYDEDTVKARISAGVPGDSALRTDNGFLAFSTADSNVLYERLRINAVGNVGIATTSPWRALSVHGSSDLGVNALAGSFTATSSTASSFPYASSTALTVSGTAYFPGSGIWNASGNVGIGTTNPTQKLEVNGNALIALQNKLYLYDTGHSLGVQQLTSHFDGASSWRDVWTASSAQGIAFWDGTDLNFEVDHTAGDAFLRGALHSAGTANSYFSGNLGIGQTSPTYKLDVTGLGHFTGLVDAASFTATSSTATTTLAGGLAIETSGLVYDYSTNRVGMGTASPISKLHVASGEISLDNNQGINFYKADGSGAAGQIYADTSNHLQITANSGARIKVTGSTELASGSSLILQNYNNSIQFDKSDGTEAFWQIFSDNASGAYAGANGLAILGGTSATTKLAIAADGNLGIASTTPWAKLSVTNTGTGPSFVVEDSTSPDTTPFIIDASGNVGVGTASLSSDKLTVSLDANSASAGNDAIRIQSATTPLKRLGLGYDTTLDAAYLYSNHDGVAAKSLLLNPYGGNVGIGTTTPGTKLVIQGAAGGSGTALNANADLFLDNNNSHYIQFGAGSGATTGVIFGTSADNNVAGLTYIQSTNKLQIYATPGTVSTFNSTGLGVGSTTPWRTLSVTGTVGFDGLTGSTGAGSLCLDSNKQVVYNSASDNCLSSTRATKHDIQNLDLNSLSLIDQLNPVSFIYNDGDGRERYGFIAEDTAAVDQHLATYNAVGAVSGIDDRSILAILVGAIKDLYAKVQDYFARTESLESEVDALKQRVNQLEAAAGSSGTHTDAATGSAPGSAEADSGQNTVAPNDDNSATSTGAAGTADTHTGAATGSEPGSADAESGQPTVAPQDDTPATADPTEAEHEEELAPANDNQPVVELPATGTE